VVAWGVPGGVWGLSGQYGHVTSFHGNAILEILGRRAPEPEPERPEPETELETELERGISPENRDFPL